MMALSTAHLFGEVWARPGLSLRDRELITVSVIAALGRERQLRLHLRGALNAGLSREELIETFMHLAYYAGYPAGFTALAIAKEVFDAVDAEAARYRLSWTTSSVLSDTRRARMRSMRGLQGHEQLRLLGGHAGHGGARDPVGDDRGVGHRPGGARPAQDEGDLAHDRAGAGRSAAGCGRRRGRRPRSRSSRCARCRRRPSASPWRIRASPGGEAAALGVALQAARRAKAVGGSAVERRLPPRRGRAAGSPAARARPPATPGRGRDRRQDPDVGQARAGHRLEPQPRASAAGSWLRTTWKPCWSASSTILRKLCQPELSTPLTRRKSSSTARSGGALRVERAAPDAGVDPPGRAEEQEAAELQDEGAVALARAAARARPRGARRG